MPIQPIQIAIADDEALFRKGLGMLLEDYQDLSIVLEAENGQDLLNQLYSTQDLPDVLLLDMKMPVLNGVETAKLMREHFPDIPIIILSTHFSKAFILNMIEMGAASYLPKNTDPDEVVETIKSVLTKGFYYTNEVMQIIREDFMNKNQPKVKVAQAVDITTREKEVLQLICEEYTTSEIADKLYISPRTVEGHRNNLLSKLGCRNMAGLVVNAIHLGLVKLKGKNYWE